MSETDAEDAPPRLPKRMPIFGSPFRAFASGMAALIIFLGFAVYALISANAALPGDWQYPIKLQTERVRLALAFSDEAKLDLKLDVADERVSEIEQLTKHGEIIGPGVLDRAAKQTQTLIDDANNGGWDAGKAARLENVAQKQQEVLSDTGTQFAPEAQYELAAIAGVSKNAQEISKQILFFADPQRPVVVLTPSVPLASSAPLPPGSVPSTGVQIGSTPVETRGGVKLFAVKAGSLTFVVPGPSDGWKLVDPLEGVPPLVKFSNQDNTSLFAVNTQTGDMYWYVVPSSSDTSRFDEVQMRVKQTSGVFVADRVVLRIAYGNASDIPWYVMQSIELIPTSPAEGSSRE